MEKEKQSAYEYRINAERKGEFDGPTITCTREAQEYARKFWHEDVNIYESMFMIMMNQANKVTGWAKISQGGVSGTVVDMKIVAKLALDALASQVMIFHNHPSGSARPSVMDRKLTEKAKSGLSMLDIKLVDHIIITETGWYLFAEEECI